MFDLLKSSIGSLLHGLPSELAPSLETQVKGAFGEVKLQEKDLADALDGFELRLLEADVALETANHIMSDVKDELVGKPVKLNELGKLLKDAMRKALRKRLPDAPDLLGQMQKKPFVILFLGPNGHGKTTTLVKVAHWLRKNGKTVILAAADTFRSGAIHQLDEHAKRLGFEIVKHEYGGDPAAVAFDAIKAAKARGIDVVLVDTAGRQETNRNLMEEMKKIVRVATPDFTIYIGEALVGHAIVEQVGEFGKMHKIDAVILTKADADAKGGAVLSVGDAAGKPVLFLGVGQGDGDLQKFEPDEFVEGILA